MPIGPFRESVDVTIDTSAVGPYLESKTQAIRDALAERMNAVDLMLMSKAQEKVSGDPIKIHTGLLESSVRVIQVAVSEQEITGGFQAGSTRTHTTSLAGVEGNYADFLEYGTRDHIIEAINAKALVFDWLTGGALPGESTHGTALGKTWNKVAFKRVHHPGNRAYAFMRGTLDENSQTTQEEFQDAADSALK